MEGRKGTKVVSCFSPLVTPHDVPSPLAVNLRHDRTVGDVELMCEADAIDEDVACARFFIGPCGVRDHNTRGAGCQRSRTSTRVAAAHVSLILSSTCLACRR